MPVPNQRDPDEIQLLRTLRTGLADLQALVVARWGRIPNQTTDPTSPPDGTVWIRSDTSQLNYRTGGATLRVGQSYGFHVFRSTNMASQGTGTSVDITFDTLIAGKGGFASLNPAANAFTVPAGGAGAYVLAGGIYLGGVSTANVFTAVNINNVAIASVAPVNAERFFTAGVTYLNAGDVIRLQVNNTSGGNITVATFSGDKNTPEVPFLSAWRLSS